MIHRSVDIIYFGYIGINIMVTWLPGCNKLSERIKDHAIL